METLYRGSAPDADRACRLFQKRHAGRTVVENRRLSRLSALFALLLLLGISFFVYSLHSFDDAARQLPLHPGYEIAQGSGHP